MLNKIELRKQLLQKRRAISSMARQFAAESAVQLLTAADVFCRSQHIACYLAMDNEFDCTPIIEKIWQQNKSCYLPVLSEPSTKTLEFAVYQPKTAMKPNRFHIPEPIDSSKIALAELDLILLPLVGFDLQGNRLGMGGGYYDRTLSVLRENQQTKKCFLLGLGYEAQFVPELPHDEWDVLLDGVVTENSLCLFNEV